MTEDKDVSKNGYIWGHFGVILFHSIIAVLLIYLSYANVKIASKNGELTMKRYRSILFITGCVLLIVSLLSLWPIFADYDKVEKVVIVKN